MIFLIARNFEWEMTFIVDGGVVAVYWTGGFGPLFNSIILIILIRMIIFIIFHYRILIIWIESCWQCTSLLKLFLFLRHWCRYSWPPLSSAFRCLAWISSFHWDWSWRMPETSLVICLFFYDLIMHQVTFCKSIGIFGSTFINTKGHSSFKCWGTNNFVKLTPTHFFPSRRSSFFGFWGHDTFSGWLKLINLSLSRLPKTSITTITTIRPLNSKQLFLWENPHTCTIIYQVIILIPGSLTLTSLPTASFLLRWEG